MTYTPEELYNALAYAETGSFKDPWIRTTYAPKGGSTAFGPVQITNTLLQDALENKLIGRESRGFARQVMEPMYQNFIKYGREPKKPGYTPIYDYGGGGGFDPAYHENYQDLAKELIQMQVARSSDINDFIKRWRGKNEPAYRDKVMSQLIKRK